MTSSPIRSSGICGSAGHGKHGPYDGGSSKTMADDPLVRLLPVGNQGGFRCAGSPRQGSVRLGVLYTTAAEPD